MSGTRVEHVTWLLALIACGFCVAALSGDVPPRELSTEHWPVIETPLPPDTAMLRRQALAAYERNPFRLSRSPADVRPVAQEFHPSVPAVLHPPLRLKGIIGGPPWEAILEGVPRRPAGMLVAVGDSPDGLRVLLVSRDSVVIAGTDTTWVLTLFGQVH